MRYEKPGLFTTAILASMLSMVDASGATDYERISSLPCTTYLTSYRKSPDPLWDRLWDAITDYTGGSAEDEPKAKDMRPVDVIWAVACECKLHETETIGAAVARVIEASQLDLHPIVPVGGTATRQEQKWASAFDKWITNKGPRPSLRAGLACNYSR